MVEPYHFRGFEMQQGDDMVRLALGLVVVLLVCPVFGWAATEAVADSVLAVHEREGPADYSGRFTLEEIVIEGARPDLEKTGRLRVIPAEELEERGVRTLDEALNLVPGLNVRVGAGGVPRLDIRGLRSRHVLLLLDGIPLNSTYDGQMDPRLIPVEIIKKIKVTYGTGSSLYGTGALGGVINIITRREEGAKTLFLQEETGLRVGHSGILRAAGTEGDFDYFLSLGNEQRTGFDLAHGFTATDLEDGGRRENSDQRRTNGLLRVNLRPSDRWQWGLTVGRQRATFGLPPITATTTNDIYANRARFERVDGQDGRLFQMTSTYDAPGPWEFRFWFFRNRQAEETNGYDDATYAGMTTTTIKDTFHQDSRTLVRGQTLQASRTMGKDGALTVSFASERDDWQAEGMIRDVAAAGGGGGGGGGGGKGGGAKLPTTYTLRAFASDRTLRYQTWAAEYSCRLGRDIDFVGGTNMSRCQREDRGSDTAGEYNLGLAKDLNDHTRMHVAVARKIRFPAVQQLYDETSGNADLSPERAVNLELGFDFDQTSRTQYGMTLFQSTVKNYIEKLDSSSRYENYQDYLFRGVELTVRHQCRRRLALQGGLTLMSSKDRTENSGRDELQFRPKVKLTAAGTYTARSGGQAHLEVLHLDGQHYYSRTTPLEKASLNTITVANLRLAKPLRGSPLTVFAGIDNLFDRDYDTAYGVPAPGRFWYSGLQGRF
jgi:vitamin B12 transporter